MRLLHVLTLGLLSLCGIVLVTADLFTDDRSSLVLTNGSYASINPTGITGIPQGVWSRTITMWVKLYNVSYEQVMYGQNSVNSGCDDSEWAIGYSAKEKTFFASRCDLTPILGPASITVEANKWYHLTAQYWYTQYHGGVSRMYVNGVIGVVQPITYLDTSTDSIVLGHRLISTLDSTGTVTSSTSAHMSGEIGQINFYTGMATEPTEGDIKMDMNTGVIANNLTKTILQLGVNNINRTYGRINDTTPSPVTLHNGAYVHVLEDVVPDSGTSTGNNNNNTNNNNTNTNTNSTTTKEPGTTIPPTTTTTTTTSPPATATSAPTKIPTDSDTIVVRSITFEVYWISRVTPPVDSSIARELSGVMRSLTSMVNVPATDVLIDLHNIYRVKGTKDSNKGYWHVEVAFKGIKQLAPIEKALFTQKLFTLPTATNTKDDRKTSLSGLGIDERSVVENTQIINQQSCPDGTNIAASETCPGIKDSSATATHVSLMLIPLMMLSSWMLSLF